MSLDQIDELIRIRTEEKSQCVELLTWSRTDLRTRGAQSRLKSVIEELADLQRQKARLMESAA